MKLLRSSKPPIAKAARSSPKLPEKSNFEGCHVEGKQKGVFYLRRIFIYFYLFLFFDKISFDFSKEEGVPDIAVRMFKVVAGMTSAFEVANPEIFVVRYETYTNSSTSFNVTWFWQSDRFCRKF